MSNEVTTRIVRTVAGAAVLSLFLTPAAQAVAAAASPSPAPVTADVQTLSDRANIPIIVGPPIIVKDPPKKPPKK